MILTFGFRHGRRDDGGGSGSRTPRANGSVSAGRLAFKLGLLSFTSIFLAALAAFLTIRLRADVWRDEGMPGLPALLWFSTLLLLLTSIAAEAAYRGGSKRMSKRLLSGLVCAVAFCVMQALAWREWTNAGLPPNAQTLYAFSFYMLTVLHALHVFGGVVVHAYAWRKSSARSLRLTQGRSELVRFCAQDRHFLGVVWIVTWSALEIAARVH